MIKVFKVLGILVLVLVLVIVGAITYVTNALPNIPVQADLKVEITPERVARGEYLANSVCVCMDCHSTRDWTKFSGPLVPGTLGKGGERFDRSMGFPGEFYARNLTPFALKDWTDGEIHRAITSGVSKDGHPFFPVMPYLNYRSLDPEDVHSIIAYLRSLSPQRNDPPASKADFPVSVIMHTMPQPAAPITRPDTSDALAYGQYMVNAAGCVVCHTKHEKGEPVGEPGAGGFEFAFPNGAIVRSPNITSHTDGLGAWDKATFIARFKQYADSAYVPHDVDMAAAEFQTVMPWTMYGHMTEQDLGAIYDYLHSMPAAAGKVEKWSEPGG